MSRSPLPVHNASESTLRKNFQHQPEVMGFSSPFFFESACFAVLPCIRQCSCANQAISLSETPQRTRRSYKRYGDSAGLLYGNSSYLCALSEPENYATPGEITSYAFDKVYCSNLTLGRRRPRSQTGTYVRTGVFAIGDLADCAYWSCITVTHELSMRVDDQ